MPDSTPIDNDSRAELQQAMHATLEAGSARLRYTMRANPPELAEYEAGEGVADFRQRRARIAYTSAGEQVLEQVIDRDMTYLRLGESPGEWIELELGDANALARQGDATGFVDLLNVPGKVVRLATNVHRDDRCARYRMEINPPPSSLRDRLGAAFGVNSHSRLWLDVWTDDQGRVSRITTYDHAPRPDGTLAHGTVCITVDYSAFGVAAGVQIPRT